MICPCCSGLTYENCCKKFHDGQPANTALELMRSRYSAYALNNPDYIINTTHPKNPHYDLNKRRWKRSIQNFSRSNYFYKLEILEFSQDNKTATVTFKAHLIHNGKDNSFIERSAFIKEFNRWFYLDINS